MPKVRPIDANALKEALKCGAYSSVLKLIDRQSTLDYEPVVHAHWIDADYGKWKKCSHCFRTNQYYSKCCPWCGAKMDEEVKE